MQATDLVRKIVRIAETRGDAEQIDDAIVAHVSRALDDAPQQNAAGVISAQAEAVARALQEKGVSFQVLTQVCDSFRRVEARHTGAAAPHVPTAAALTPPAVNTRAAAPVTCTSTSAAPQPQPQYATQYGNYGTSRLQPVAPYRYGGMGGMGIGGMGVGMGTNSAMLQMDAMQDDMMANQMMMEGAMLDATGNVAAGTALQGEAMMLENQANMDRMFASGMGSGGFGMW